VQDNATKSDPVLPTSSHDPAGPAASPATPAPPPQLGVYQLQGRLGQGGMGTVWKAWHTRLKRTVALKTLRADCLGNAPALARFQREMEAVGKLDHPNLIRATDAGEAAGIHFLVMDFVEGTDAAKLVQEHGPLPIADACEMVRQAALGLQYAHEAGLVHRDVKPSNLMVTRQGQVKVLDLGLALLHAAPDETGELTGSNQWMGTADFMAPEQGASAHTVDIRADVYSLGCTLYKLLSGRAPFSTTEYSTPYKKMEAHARAPVPPLRVGRPEVPADLAAVLERMLAKAPADRFATPGEVASALAPFAAGCNLPRLVAGKAPSGQLSGGETGPFGPPTPASAQSSPLPPTVYRPRESRRFRWWAAAVVAGVGVAVGLLAWRLQHTPESAAPPPRDLAPGVWHDLLDRPPEPLHWPAGKDLPTFVPGRQRLQVVCQGRGMLRLGAAPPRTAFKLQVGFTQPEWTGRVGLFFGYRAEPEAAQADSVQKNPRPESEAALAGSFQEILLEPSPIQRGRFTLSRSLGTVLRYADGRLRPSLHGFTSEQVEKLIRHQEYRLEIAVDKNGLLNEVRWDGKMMRALSHSGPLRAGDRLVSPGGFGITILDSSAEVATARWLLSTEE
jgi:serine/threonine protein kinase